ncbi:MAG TPA: CHAP domain-containing protein [Solirubrobacteraceae bacterium]|jgi:hypothetical protein|nr:CHAP domain-containing protein [Solirubrobacteraceae bacterium]
MSACQWYNPGQCTRFCCDQWTDPVGAFWGNGAAWLESARKDGYSTTTIPTVGAIAVWGANMGGTKAAGHVAIVKAVQPLTVAESNWSVPLQPDVRIVSAYSQAGIIGYILPHSFPEDHMATIGQKRADIENFRVAAFGEWPPDLPSVDAYAVKIADDFGNVLEVHQELLNDYIAGGGKPLWRSQLPPA